jgi:thiol:disulfide interchange protein
VRILAFSSDDCVQCHRMQTPALRRVLDARPDVVVEEIDAPRAPELTHRYSVLTVPTTVVLDAAGRARAVNYGFADTQRLLEQVDAALTTAAEGEGDAERIESAS